MENFLEIRFLTKEESLIMDEYLGEVARRIGILAADLERAERIARAIGSEYVANLIADARTRANL